MKILRIRRGFTTNSSSAAEFLPDGGRIPDASTTPPPTATPRSSGPTTIMSSVAPWGNEAAPSDPPSNTTTLGMVFAAVAGAFVAGSVVRMVLRRRNRKIDDTGSGRLQG
jgi:hypothetical protein